MISRLAHSALSFCLIAAAHAQEEIPVAPRIESVGVFKNGVAVVRASIPVEKPGLLRWDRVPHVIHGTFHVESKGELEVRTTLRTIEEIEDKELPNGTLQDDLAGKQVEVRLRAAADHPERLLQGTVWDLPERTPKKRWDTNFTQVDTWSSSRMAQAQPEPEPEVSTGNFLVLEEGDGKREYLYTGNIESVMVSGPFKPKTRSVEKPVMLFNAAKIQAGSTITITYLTKGLAWIPAYRVDLSDPAKLEIRQNAVIRNELMDLKDTEVQLISGFPNMAFSHVDSPLSPEGSLAAFFQQLSQQPGSANGTQSQMVMYNNSGSSNQPALPNLAENGSAADDMHYESIGHRSLSIGDSLALEVAAGRAAYQRVVEWVVEDGRDDNGRYNVRENEPKTDESEPWDAVKFANPLRFPMTTAPAMMVEAGKFRGQSIGKWASPGQQVCLRITKALSVSAQYTETEEENQRENLMIGGGRYRRTKVGGTLTLRNSRDKIATLNVRKQFSGEMIEVTGKPQSRLRTEGVGSVNPRRELEWDFELAAGQEKVITFRYSVLVPE